MGGLLYRVVDDWSLVKFDRRTGFTAADIWTEFDPDGDPQSARNIIELHSDWSNRFPTPLVSTTDSEYHAWRLACNREEYGRTNVHVAIINRVRLESHVKVYHMLDLVKTTGAKIAPKARSYNEHVCVHRIPSDCIMRFYTLSEFTCHISGDSSDGDNEEEEEEEEEELEEEEEELEEEELELWLKWLDEEELQSSEDEEELELELWLKWLDEEEL